MKVRMWTESVDNSQKPGRERRDAGGLRQVEVRGGDSSEPK